MGDALQRVTTGVSWPFLGHSVGGFPGRITPAPLRLQACIEAGIDQGKRITGILAKIGFNKQYVGKILADHRGEEPSRHWWFRDDTGAYRILVQLDG